MLRLLICQSTKWSKSLMIYALFLGLVLVAVSGASPVFADNIPPTLDKINDQTILEDSDVTTIPLSGISAGQGDVGQTITITALSSDPSILPTPTIVYNSPDTTGSLSFAPAPNMYGDVTVTVTVKDDGGTAGNGIDSITTTFKVSIAPVNDPPSFTKGPDPVVDEDCGPQTITGWATQISAGPNETGQVLTFKLTPDQPLLFLTPPAIDPSSGTLTFTPALNANGMTTVDTILQDDGGTANGGKDSFETTFIITIAPVNDPPVVFSFDKYGTRGRTLVFSPMDFLNAYTDIENNPLYSIKIVSLPLMGKLYLDGAMLSAGAEILASQLGKLTYVPSFTWYGSTSFNWVASDGQSYASSAAAVNITYPYSPLPVYLPLIHGVPLPPWVTALNENFEGVFPGKWGLSSATLYNGLWYDVTDLVSWGKRTCHAASGMYGGWAVGGGSLGSTVSCNGSYPNNTQTWMVYGPIDLSQVKDGRITLKVWADIEYSYDEMGWGVSLDNDSFYGHAFSGDSQGWTSDTIDLKNVYSLGNVTGASKVWIGIWFESDEMNDYYEAGVAVDDLVFSTCSSTNGCSGAPIVTAPSLQPGNFLVSPAVRSKQKIMSSAPVAPETILRIPWFTWSNWGQ